MPATVRTLGMALPLILALGCSKQASTPAPPEAAPGAVAAVPTLPPTPPAATKEDPAVNEPWEPTVDRSRSPAKVEDIIVLDAVGNSTNRAVIQFAPAEATTFRRMMSRPYVEAGTLKWREPRLKSAFRYLDLERANVLLEETGGRFADDGIHLEFRETGSARQRDGNWIYHLSYDNQSEYRLTRKVYKDGIPTVTLAALSGKDAARQVVTHMQITLPRGAHDIHLATKPHQLVYAAPLAQPDSSGRASLTVQTKPHIMAAVAKVYGDRKFHKLWVARSVFRNPSRDILTDYRVRFRLAGFSDWSRWETSDRVLPGQTVIDPFYPAIAFDKVRELHGQAPVDVQIEYSYVRADGKTVSDSTAERTKILGINEGVFSDLEEDKEGTWFEAYKDAPLVLASFTSANDPVIQDVVGMLSKVTGGAPTAADDRAAIAFMKALYNLMRINISYETTPGDIVEGLRHQHLKYGRDVLRTRSGTCVNTSIFYASVLEAAGLDASIWVVPGHAFAGARLPKSRKLAVVETTGCGGGTLATSVPFDRAMAAAQKTAQKWGVVDLVLEVNIKQLRRRGVQPPELATLGKNPLEEWKIKAPAGIRDENPSPLPEPARPAARTAEEHYKAGKALAAAKKWAEAEAAFTAAIAADKANPEYYNARAVVSIARGDEARQDAQEEVAKAFYAKAAGDLATLLKIDSTFARAYHNAGDIFNRLGEHRKAISYYTKAIALDPDNARAYRNRGNTWLKLGEKAKANADFRAAEALES